MKLRLSPLLLLLALICFALPFVQVSCVNENPSPKASDAKTTLSDSLPLATSDSMTAQSAASDTVKPAPKPATPPTPEIVQLYTYTGLNMVLGSEPHNHLLDDNKDMADADPAPKKTDKASKDDVAVADSISSPEKPAASNESKPASKPEPKAEDKGPKNEINIYALIAFILIFVALLLSLIKLPLLALIAGLFSFAAAVLLYVLRLYFPGYFLAYTQLDPQALQILTIKFTPWYWAAFIMSLLAMVDSVWRFTRNGTTMQEAYSEPIILEPMDDYDQSGELIQPLETIEAEEADEAVEPIDAIDDNKQDPPLT